MGLTTLTFDSMDAMDNYVKADSYVSNTQICFGVYLHTTTTAQWDYSLRFNTTQSANRGDIYPTNSVRTTSLGV